MNKEDLTNRIGFILEEGEKELQLFGFVSGDDTPYRISLSPDLESELIDVFAFGVSRYIIEKEYEIVNYSTADERMNRYYLYDLQEMPDRMACMSLVIGNHNLNCFDFNHHTVSEINSLIALISDGNGNTFTIYKVLSPVEKIAKSANLLLAKIGIGNDVLEEVQDPLLKIGPKFQIVFSEANGEGAYVFLESSIVEGQFDLHQILNNQATRDISIIERTYLLKDVTKLYQYINKASFSKRLVGVMKSSKVIREGLSKDQIFEFIENDEELRSDLKIKEDNSGERFIDITSLKSAKRFLDLLNDDFVYSTLTSQKYQAVDKDER